VGPIDSAYVHADIELVVTIVVGGTVVVVAMLVEATVGIIDVLLVVGPVEPPHPGTPIITTALSIASTAAGSVVTRLRPTNSMYSPQT